MLLKPGDLVVVPFPFTDLSSRKSRPAVVVSAEAFNASGSDVVLVAVTSNVMESAFSVLITSDDLEDGTLPKPSRVKVGKIIAIDRTLVRRRIGRLRGAVLDQVYRELRGVFPERTF